MSKEVVLGGDVWDLLDELMIYMGNPMQYYERDVKFVRVAFSSLMKLCLSFAFILVKEESFSSFTHFRVFFSLDLLELVKLFLQGHLQRKAGYHLFLLQALSSQIVRKVVLQKSMRCFLLQGEM